MAKLNTPSTLNNKGTHFSILKGLVIRSKDRIKDNFDLGWFTKWFLGRINVPYNDPCCDSLSEVNPVRMNTTGGSEGLEKYDPSTETWVAANLYNQSAASFVASTSVSTPSLTSNTTDIEIEKNIIQHRVGAAIDVTDTATVIEIQNGLITSTSAAAVALTLPTATDLATALSAVQGTSVDFMVDNSAGANTVTVTVNTGITAVTAVVTGGDTLTVASGAVGTFRIFFTSATVAKIARII